MVPSRKDRYRVPDPTGNASCQMASRVRRTPISGDWGLMEPVRILLVSQTSMILKGAGIQNDDSSDGRLMRFQSAKTADPA